MNVADALTARISINNFDAEATISEAEITELVRLAQQAPSSYNIQFTRFVAVTDSALKERLKAVAWGQPKVGAAAVVFVLTGNLKAHEAFADRTRAAGAAGHMPTDMADKLAGMAVSAYSNPAKAREESIRSVGMSGMALMLAAEERGWVSGPMIGFDPAAFSEILGLDANHPPLMLVVVGKPAPGNIGRKPRLAPADVLRFNGGNF